MITEEVKLLRKHITFSSKIEDITEAEDTTVIKCNVNNAAPPCHRCDVLK